MYKEIFGKPLSPGDIIGYATTSGRLALCVVLSVTEKAHYVNEHAVAIGWQPYDLKVKQLLERPPHQAEMRTGQKEGLVVKLVEDEFFASPYSDEDKTLVRETIRKFRK